MKQLTDIIDTEGRIEPSVDLKGAPSTVIDIIYENELPSINAIMTMCMQELNSDRGN